MEDASLETVESMLLDIVNDVFYVLQGLCPFVAYLMAAVHCPKPTSKNVVNNEANLKF